jgi:subtilisin family serine protease
VRRPKSLLLLAVVPLVTGLAVAAAPMAAAQPALSGKTTEFSVLAADGASLDSVQAAVRAAGGTVVRSNAAVGLVTATAPRNGFSERLRTSHAVLGAAPVTVIGHNPKDVRTTTPKAVEHEKGTRGAKAKKAANGPGMDPLDSQLWGLNSVRSDLARTKQAGNKKVKVGIIDTGVDGNHPDIAPNFDKADSRNFVKDIPFDELGQEVDGPCEFRGCVDPVDWDDGAHGTHVAGTIAAAANGFGVSGVAPNVSIVNIRAGQDAGFFFLAPTVDALTYSGDAGIDVVNMSFFVDPWLFNCDNNPADTPDQQAEQRVIKTAMNRAMNYAYRHGVTQVVALGNEHSDLGNPLPDVTSPDYPTNTEHPRTIDVNTCVTMPTEGPHSIGVGSFGPSQAKSDFSNYGMEQISVSAPGGWFRDYFGTPRFRTVENEILSTYPKNAGVADGNIDADGNVTPAGVTAGVQKACKANGVCGYYQFLQGTSMATPHATGVAALIVSQYGKVQGNKISMNPDKVQNVLEGTAAKVPCPTPRTVDYLDEGRDASFTATCNGDLSFNDFYGHGAVDAYAAVTRGKQYL